MTVYNEKQMKSVLCEPTTCHYDTVDSPGHGLDQRLEIFSWYRLP